MLMHGRELRLPGTLYDEVTPGTATRPRKTEDRTAMLSEIFQIVRRNMAKATQDQARHYNLRRRVWKPQLGEKVLVKQHYLSNAADGFAAKLAPKFDGPYEVKEFASPVIVIVKRVGDNRERTVHIRDIKTYGY